MFKLLVLSAVFSMAVAGYSPLTTLHKEVYPGKTVVKVEPQVKLVEEPFIHQVGEHVARVPTAVSHQSSTIVHSSDKIVTPILAHGVKKSVVPAEPKITTYQEPAVVKTVATHTYPYALPLQYASYNSYPSYPSFSSYPGYPILPYYGGLTYSKY